MVRKPSRAPGNVPSTSTGGSVPVAKVPNDLPHGSRQVLEAQASAGASSAGASSGGGPVLPPVPTTGVFGPTSRPGEPISAGAPVGPGPGPTQPAFEEDPDIFLRAVYSRFPHPDIARLLMRVTRA